MNKKDTIIIIATILTLILAEVFLFVRLYNQYFEIKENTRGNPYVLLRNGKYFELECENDVLDNKIDFSFKPFEERLDKNLASNLTSYEQVCSDGNGNNKEIVFKKKREDLKIIQNISTHIQDTKDKTYYYTQIDYPVTPKITDHGDKLEIYDSNCITTIPKRIDYEYILLEKSIRIGRAYSENIVIEIDMNIQCL